MSNSAFISYRRTVSAFIARAVFLDLQAHGIDTFMDVESITTGAFDTVILNQIAARPYFLLILTPGSLDRCIEPDDWLLREITHASKLKRVIIPLMTPYFNAADFGKFLPEPIRTELPRQNGVTLPHEYFEAAMEKLRTRFLMEIDLPLTAPSAAESDQVRQAIAQINAEPPITEALLNAQDYFERGLRRAGEGNLTGALSDLTAAIDANPQLAEAYYQRGQVNDQLGNRLAAALDYDKGLKLDRRDDPALREYIARWGRWR
jgi:hypothetical protein